MSEFDIEPIFLSICSTVVVEEEDQIPRVLREIGEIGSNALFSNQRIEIRDENVTESVLEFSTGQLEEPSHNEREYVLVDFYDDLESNQIHIHSYFRTDTIDIIDNFYSQIIPKVKQIGIGSVEANLSTNANISELGFGHKNDNEVLLEGVRFSYNSQDYSVYLMEDSTIIRGFQNVNLTSLEDEGYRKLVREKLDELQASVEKIAL